MRLNFPLQPVPLSSQFPFPASSPFQPVLLSSQFPGILYVKLYFLRTVSYCIAMTSFFSATYYYLFYGYLRRGPVSRA
jgi:hypothetical protein